MTDPKRAGGEAVPPASSQIQIDAVAAAFQRRAIAAENAEIHAAKQVRDLIVLVRSLTAELESLRPKPETHDAEIGDDV